MKGDYTRIRIKFDGINYYPYLFGKIIPWVRMPSKIGRWLHRYGYAVEHYYGARMIDDE